MQTTHTHLPALMYRGGTYAKNIGQAVKSGKTLTFATKIYWRLCVNALIGITQKLYPFVLLTSCHLTSQTRSRTSTLSLLQQFNPVDTKKTFPGRSEARLEVASTRDRDAFGKRQFTALYSTAATYSCLHPSPLLPPLLCVHKERH